MRIGRGLFGHMNTFGTHYQRTRYTSSASFLWMARHFDLLIRNDYGSEEIMLEANPNLQMVTYFMTHYWFEWMLNRPESSPREWGEAHGVGFPQSFLEYQVDVSTPAGEFAAGSDAIEAPNNPGQQHYFAPIFRESYRQWAAYWINTRMAYPYGAYTMNVPPLIAGAFFDLCPVMVSQLSAYHFEQMEGYLWIPPTLSHPRIQDNFEFVVNVTDKLSQMAGAQKMGIGNMNSLWTITTEPYRSFATQYLRSALIESWFPLNFSGVLSQQPWHDAYVSMMQKVVADVGISGNQRLLWAKETNPSDGGKILSLAWFYLWNRPEFSFAYSKADILTGNPQDIHWFPAMEYDVGDPEGDWYVYAQGPDPSDHTPPISQFHVLARRYTNAFIIVKLRPHQDSVIGPSSETMIRPPEGRWKILNADGTFSEEVTRVGLWNNSATIFVPMGG